MKTTDFSAYSELPLSWEEDVEALSYIEIMKDMLVDNGFAQQAVDALKFDVRAFTLNLTEDEKKHGAWHRFDGGAPFYEISITTSSTLEDLAIGKGRINPQSLPYETQSAHMLLDIAGNCFAKLEKLSAHFGSAAANTNMSSENGFTLDLREGMSTHVATRKPLDEFFGAAADLLVLHLANAKKQPTPVLTLVGGTDAPRFK